MSTTSKRHLPEMGFASANRFDSLIMRHVAQIVLSSLFGVAMFCGIIVWFVCYHALVLVATPFHWVLRAFNREGLLYINWRNPPGRYATNLQSFWGFIPRDHILAKRA